MVTSPHIESLPPGLPILLILETDAPELLAKGISVLPKEGFGSRINITFKVELEMTTLRTLII